jgi:hypothetical protein
MKVKSVIAFVVLSFTSIAGGQAAGTWDMSSTVPFKGAYGQVESSPSRAQVQAELRQARAAGLVRNGDIDNVPFDGIYGQDSPSVGRAHVQAELLQARGAGPAGNGDIDNQPFHGD